MFIVIGLFVNRLNLNSKNSSKPPSTDPNRKKKNNTNMNGNKPGGQHGHVGRTLKPVSDPDEIKLIPLNKKTLPSGRYRDAGYCARQVINIRISRHVIEYRAQILKNENGAQFTAPFPTNVTRPVMLMEKRRGYTSLLTISGLIFSLIKIAAALP